MTIKIRTKLNFSLNNAIMAAVVTVLLAFYYFSPLTKSFGLIRYFLSIFMLLVTYTRKSLTRVLPTFLFTSAVLLLLVLSGRLSERGFNAPISHATHFTAWLIVTVIAEYLKRAGKELQRYFIQLALFFLSVSTLISIYYVLRVNQYAIRFNEAYGLTNVLRFSQTYAICLLSDCLFFVILCTRKQKTASIHSWLFFVFALFTICIILSLFATALILMLIGMLLGIAILMHDRHKIALVILIGLAILLGILVLGFPEQIANLIYSLTENLNWIIRLRVRGIVDLLLQTDLSTEYTMERRTELAFYSLTTFRNHPLLGIGYRGFGYGIIGMHQEWFDLLGTFGLFGTILFAAIFGTYLRSIYLSCVDTMDKRTFLLCLCLFLVLGFLNPCMSFQVLFVLMCVAPHVSSLVKTVQEG